MELQERLVENRKDIEKKKKTLGKYYDRFKLMIYDWDVDKTIKYYEKDAFCIGYCIGMHSDEYGCPKFKYEKDCKSQFEHSMTLHDLIIGHKYLDTRDYPKARLLCLYFMSLNKYNKSNAALFFYYATLLRYASTDKKDFLLCQKYYLKMNDIDNDFNNGLGHWYYGQLLENTLLKYKKSFDEYKQAIKLDGQNSSYYHDMGQLMVKMNRIEKSIEYYKKCLQLDPKNARYQYSIAMSYDTLRNIDNARSHFGKALELNEENVNEKLSKQEIMFAKKMTKNHIKKKNMSKNNNNQTTNGSTNTTNNSTAIEKNVSSDIESKNNDSSNIGNNIATATARTSTVRIDSVEQTNKMDKTSNTDRNKKNKADKAEKVEVNEVEKKKKIGKREKKTDCNVTAESMTDKEKNLLLTSCKNIMETMDDKKNGVFLSQPEPNVDSQSALIIAQLKRQLKDSQKVELIVLLCFFNFLVSVLYFCFACLFCWEILIGM